ncbi:MAG: hypothetical protein FWC23_10320 [Chitinispirillia bacterium]|nr:hypothetical protein [Chitinispirillia bacterium]MCL2269562.1 hypothetical protein [Chitinispirillia bacterium]
MVKGCEKKRSAEAVCGRSHLKHWPIQIGCVPPIAPFFENAHLLVAADCVAYACADFHARYMKGKVTLIGCPKLDSIDSIDKFAAILRNNSIKSVTIVRMDASCCRGIVNAVITALQGCGKVIPWWSVTLSTRGEVVSG